MRIIKGTKRESDEKNAEERADKRKRLTKSEEEENMVQNELFKCFSKVNEKDVKKQADKKDNLLANVERLGNSLAVALHDAQQAPSPSMTPMGLALKPFQLEGMNWIATLGQHQVNGILADDMGLGKTIQTIAYLAHTFEKEGGRKKLEERPHLVIVPPSTLHNW
jgi:SNF2 family DNA or RNA helicase